MSSHNREASRDRELVLHRHQTVPMYVFDIPYTKHGADETDSQIVKTKVGQF
jgi:hypothetical protein